MGRFISKFKKAEHLLNYFGIEIKRRTKNKENTIVSLKSRHPVNGNVLLAYIIDPFLLKEGQSISIAHTHHFESTLLAKSFLELGYDVDVISFRNREFIPKKDYAFYINARDNFSYIASRLNKDCINIVHLDTAHFLYNNYAAYSRSLDLQKRRRATIISAKLFKCNWAIETADYATILGNKFTIGTYSYAGTPIFPLPIPSPILFEQNNSKDFTSCKNNFLWFGSSGLIHKGLDLVLEAFVSLPEYNLTVCGPLEGEQDFVDLYHEELFHTTNIKTIGWVDIKSEIFNKIINDCVALVYPSCAEGQAGAVITCMHAGLIPIVSYESGIDVNDYGLVLKHSSVNEIIESIKYIAQTPVTYLKEMSNKAYLYARKNHVGDKYILEHHKAIEEIIRLESNK